MMISSSKAKFFLGSARASRAGDGAIAIANFFRKRLFRRGAETSTRGARAPQILLPAIVWKR
jgi:hypothetical protein